MGHVFVETSSCDSRNSPIGRLVSVVGKSWVPHCGAEVANQRRGISIQVGFQEEPDIGLA